VRIEGQKPVGASAAGGVRKGGAVSGERFSLAEESAPTVANSAAPESASALAALMALQEVDDPLFARRKSVRRGHALLDALEAMKADLLVGRVSEGRLNRIIALTSQAKTGTQDAELESIVAEIELRAKVELAKLGIF
jgi:hypothetical protein